MANYSVGVRAWQRAQQMEQNYIKGNFDAARADAASVQAYMALYGSTQDVTGLVAFFTWAKGAGALDIVFTPLTVTDATAPVAGECTWDFGDGSSTVTGLSPTHTYSASGTYTVKLTVDTAALGPVVYSALVKAPYSA